MRRWVLFLALVTLSATVAAGVSCDEDLGRQEVTEARERPVIRTRVRVLEIEGLEIEWLPEFAGEDPAEVSRECGSERRKLRARPPLRMLGPLRFPASN